MIPIILECNMKVGLKEIKAQLQPMGFLKTIKIKEDTLILPGNLLFHPSLLSINAAHALLSIAILRAHQKDKIQINKKDFEVKKFIEADYMTLMSNTEGALRS